MPNGSFETLNRDMAGQLGVEPSSLEGLGKKLEQGVALVEPKVPKGSFETKQGGVEPSSLEGLRNWGKGWP